MRLVVWNCADGFTRKSAILAGLRPDVAIVPEVRQPALAAWPGRSAWAGEADGRGIAILARPGIGIEPLPLPGGCRWLTAVALADVAIIGFWAKRGTDGTYSASLHAALDTAAPLLASGACILAGDFNAHPRWDRPGRRGFSAAVERLAASGLVSAWHRHTGEPHGAESAATLYFRRHRERPYHIDYCFLPDGEEWRPRQVAIGDHDDWVAAGHSDHVPLIVDL